MKKRNKNNNLDNIGCRKSEPPGVCSLILNSALSQLIKEFIKSIFKNVFDGNDPPGGASFITFEV